MVDIAMLHIRENKQINFEPIETTVAATEVCFYPLDDQIVNHTLIKNCHLKDNVAVFKA
ncbi:hypothetical protein H6G94_35505 [Nostoc punctiforme FACHB-252]|uniref:Uncharacterized protein n=1 Tax=Nostoc punctiforme FACHB-252 TaxID=1357509 RepID=A0ABR8HKU1_NOSPU|nr:hypothetical protein [Nostoc punctiforme]MBD2616470.1 hypothetical protein [Nostoc punctiforme FACHB-252]